MKQCSKFQTTKLKSEKHHPTTIIQPKSPTSMHAFPACLQDSGSISRSNLHVRTSHGQQLSAIGWQEFRPDYYAKTQSKVKVRLSEQFPAQNISHNISSSRWRELITRAKFWKLVPTQILTPKSKFNDSHKLA